MNANELADKLLEDLREVDLFNMDSVYYGNRKHYIDQLESLVRQQQAEIEALKAKTLTDEEIISSAEEARFNWSEDKGIFVRHSNGSWIGLDSKIVDFARAILRKASE